MTSFDSSYATVLNSFLSYSSAMDYVATNISNVNTNGYKRYDVQFLSNEHNTLTSPFREYMGNVQMFARNQINLNGLFVSADRPTYAAIAGNGFFPVKQNLNGNINEIMLTAEGSFEKKLITEGNVDHVYLVNASGSFLLGWPYNQSTGQYMEGNGLNSLQPVEVDSIHNTSKAKPTTLATLIANLPATDDPAQKIDHIIDFNTFDGITDNSHTIASHLKKIDKNSWSLHFTTPDGTITQPNTIILQFNAEGKLVIPQKPVDCHVSWIKPKTTNINFKIDLTKFTQYASPFNITKVQSDGQGSGSLQNLKFDKNGIIKATFSNGEVRPIFKIPSATVRAVNQMARESSELFKPTIASGEITLNDFEKIQHAVFLPQQLMESNVNQAISLGNSIKFEEGYQETTDAFHAVQKTIQEAIDLIQS